MKKEDLGLNKYLENRAKTKGPSSRTSSGTQNRLSIGTTKDGKKKKKHFFKNLHNNLTKGTTSIFKRQKKQLINEKKAIQAAFGGELIPKEITKGIAREVTQKIPEKIKNVVDKGEGWTEKEKDEQQIVTDSITSSLEKVTSILKVSKTYNYQAASLVHLRTDITGIINKV